MTLYLAYLLHSHIFQITRAQKDLKMSVVQVQVDYQTEEWYIVAKVIT